MTVYVRYKRVPVKYYWWCAPWYRWLDWYQGNDIAARFWTSRTGRFLIWFVPKFLVVAWILLRLLAAAIVIVGAVTAFMFLSFALGGGKRRR